MRLVADRHRTPSRRIIVLTRPQSGSMRSDQITEDETRSDVFDCRQVTALADQFARWNPKMLGQKGRSGVLGTGCAHENLAEELKGTTDIALLPGEHVP